MRACVLGDSTRFVWAEDGSLWTLLPGTAGWVEVGVTLSVDQAERVGECPAAVDVRPLVVVWRRMWDGDGFDNPRWVYREDANDCDEPLNRWEPLYAASLTLPRPAVAEVLDEDMGQVLYAKVRWLLNPMPVGSLLYEELPGDESHRSEPGSVDPAQAIRQQPDSADGG